MLQSWPGLAEGYSNPAAADELDWVLKTISQVRSVTLDVWDHSEWVRTLEAVGNRRAARAQYPALDVTCAGSSSDAGMAST